MFVDQVEIELHAGRGGDGCMSFRREKYVPRGGPDGGDGGNGGSIILEARAGTNSLASFANRKFYHAEKGQPGMGSMRHGRNGRDMRLFVPCGTSVIDAADRFVIKDLVRPGEQFVAARGGKGGYGNARFKTSVNQAPRERQSGADGESRHVILELKSIADVGLIGKPNAGKSTLLSRISSARPEVADYPFTTKHPNLGIVDVDLERSFVMADIPGLIEGASEGVGLGYEFLRHIQRAGVLVHLIEPTPIDGTDPVENYHAIREELKHYDAALAERDELVVMTKQELDPDGEVLGRLRQALQAEPPGHRRDFFAISAVADIGLRDLIEAIMTGVTQRREAMAEAGEELLPIRLEDTAKSQNRKRRVPPHKVGLTATLSNEHQAKDVPEAAPSPPADSDAASVVPGEPRRASSPTDETA